MHQAGGFLDQKTRSPLGLGAAIAINGAVVGALLFAAPAVVKQLPTVIEMINVTPEKPPEPVVEPPKARVEAQQPKSQILVAKPPVASKEPDFVKADDMFPPLKPGTGEGTGTIVDPLPKQHIPVLTGSKIHPRYVDALQPPYPAGMQRIGMEGVAIVRVLVGTDGRVKRVERVEAADDAFFKATETQALRKWRFVPATRDGVAIEEWRTMTVRFRLAG